MKKSLLFVAALFMASVASAAFVQDFESGELGDWTIIDADGDGYNWTVVDGTNNKLHNGNYAITSASYLSGSSLTPDNFLVSPKVALGGQIIFWAIGQDSSWPAEHFGVAVSVAGNTDADDFEMVSGEFIATSEWTKIIVDLSEFAGQEGYVAIRHYNVTDMFRLNIDDIVILADGEEEPQPVVAEVPTNLAASQITAESAIISWDGEGDSFDLVYQNLVEPLASNSFEEGLGDWTTIDADGDDFDWFWGDDYDLGNIACSASYDNATRSALTPDNFLVSPKVELGGKIVFWAKGQDVSYAAEHFGVAVSVAGNTDADDFEMVSGEFIATSEWAEISVDLSEFAGQEGYVAIRHFNVTDMYLLDIADVAIYAADAAEEEMVAVEGIEENAFALTELDPETTYLVTVRSHLGEDVSAWSEALVFTTLKESEGVENVESATKATKRLIDNQLIIEKNSKKFNVLGTEIR